jgi:tripeptide aminopeptidase
VTIASPTLFMYEIQVKGQSAHSGIEPEKGISAVSILSEALQKILIVPIFAVVISSIRPISIFCKASDKIETADIPLP